jgi:hypothetical protein
LIPNPATAFAYRIEELGISEPAIALGCHGL